MYRSLFALLVIVAVAGLAVNGTASVGDPATLPPAVAVGVELDTLLIGGYASGRFTEAVEALASDLSPDERTLVGQQLERIFAGVLDSDGLGRTGRLRVAYERALRPNGTTRSIRVLGTEVATSGRLHTAYYFETDGRPGYFDPFGRSLDGTEWLQPLSTLRVTSSFGDQRLHPILKRWLPHTGVDFSGRMGEPVRAASDGIVAAAGPQGGYGLLVELQHPNGYGTRYAHLSRIEATVMPARVVRRGQIIGYVGMTGLATGPHLHYEIRRRGQPVDPIAADGSAGPPLDLGSDPRWVAERRVLSAMLGQTPTMVRIGR